MSDEVNTRCSALRQTKSQTIFRLVSQPWFLTNRKLIIQKKGFSRSWNLILPCSNKTIFLEPKTNMQGMHNKQQSCATFWIKCLRAMNITFCHVHTWEAGCTLFSGILSPGRKIWITTTNSDWWTLFSVLYHVPSKGGTIQNTKGGERLFFITSSCFF